MAENKGNPKQDELVAKLVKDAQAPPDALLLSGYVGASSEEGHTRLYFDPQLSDYVEIPNDAILHTQEIPKDQSPLGGTLIWIKRDAVLVHGKVGPNRLKAKFLEGRIQQEFVKAQAAGIPGQPGVPLVTLPDVPGCRTEFGPVCPTLPAGFCPTHAPIGCPTSPAICTHFGLQCPTHQLECTRFGPHCPTLAPSLCPTCAAPICPTHQPPCTHVGPSCPTAGPTIPAICCIPPTSPLHGCPPPTPLHGCPPPTPLCPSLAAHLCPTLPVICGAQTLPAAQCPITVLPPCPIASGPVCGGGIGSVACGGGPGGPVAEAATIVCTRVGPACGTQQIHCTIGGPACGITGPQCLIQSAFCPTPACPTHQIVACTIGGPACGITGPQCPIQSPLCPVSAVAPCLTQHQPVCQPSVIIQCPTHQIQCLPSVYSPCLTVNSPVCQPSLLTPCVTHLFCTAPPQCPIATAIGCPPVSLACPQGPGGVGPGPVAGGFAQAAAAPEAALLITSPVICQPAHTLFCPQTQHFLQCHPTIPCHTQPIICLQVTHVGCPFPTQFCPSAFCPSGPACGGGGFGGLGQ